MGESLERKWTKLLCLVKIGVKREEDQKSKLVETNFIWSLSMMKTNSNFVKKPLKKFDFEENKMF